ncbi:MAG TPA: histone deacetylase [Candidatus Bathyarchaeia archaeon]|nr:histone deacetylase [Candidatus Bathyarchaeia archaeon]
MPTALTIDSRFRDHDPGPGHPERPDRIAVLLDLVEHWRGARLERIAARHAEESELRRVHTETLVDRVRATTGRARHHLDADTPTSADSFATALLAAGGVCELVDAVAGGAAQNGFALVRPPGHHATRDTAMGFCLFNNVAIAAERLRHEHHLERVAIVDWDVHHGNGTQDIFLGDPGVLYVSTHQSPFYPGTGAVGEVGVGDGEGFTINLPFSPGVGDAGYLLAFEEIVRPILRQFAPEFVLVSAGFDCHHRDPLGGMAVTEEGFAGMTQILLDVARETAGGRLVAVLEGGYDLDAIRESTEAVLGELTHERAPRVVAETRTPGFEKAKQLFRKYWQLD